MGVDLRTLVPSWFNCNQQHQVNHHVHCNWIQFYVHVSTFTLSISTKHVLELHITVSIYLSVSLINFRQDIRLHCLLSFALTFLVHVHTFSEQIQSSTRMYFHQSHKESHSRSQAFNADGTWAMWPSGFLTVENERLLFLFSANANNEITITKVVPNLIMNN